MIFLLSVLAIFAKEKWKNLTNNYNHIQHIRTFIKLNSEFIFNLNTIHCNYIMPSNICALCRRISI